MTKRASTTSGFGKKVSRPYMDAQTKRAFDIACAVLGLNQREGMRGAVDLLLLVSRKSKFVEMAESQGLSVVDQLEEVMQDAVGRSCGNSGNAVATEGPIPARIGSLLSEKRKAGAPGD